MLKEAIELQQKAVKELQEQLDLKTEITFKAPTGSGKTFMMADFMNRVLSERDDVIFLISSLSKGNLAKQNYDKFVEYSSAGRFQLINPYLINTNISGEESLFIPLEYNVYLLPRDLYKAGGRLMQGSMESFLNAITMNNYFGGLEKKIILIKDECHIATKNLDTLSESFFDKIINFSATPNLRRGQHPDVEITDEEAVSCSLIKHIELGDEEETVADALNKFEEIKDQYRNLLGVNPCLIIQISNKEKADFELEHNIFLELNKVEHQDLKWMLIVDKDNKCDTNDVFKAKKMPVSRWKDYAKENTSGIDVIIFKMVISEGWDIPRACMLYQIRKSQSDQLDEQVMGRVRRNPRLLDFENLSEEAKNLATTAWVWGILPDSKKKVYGVKLFDEPTDITNELMLKTTKINKLTKKKGFNLNEFIESQTEIGSYSSIFDMFKRLNSQEDHIRELCYDYSDTVEKWWKFNEHLDKIVSESNKYTCDYANSMEIDKDEKGNESLKSVPVNSTYTDNGNYINIVDWIWKRRDGKDKFSFDSDAERQWASVIKDLVSNEADNGLRAVKQVVCGTKNPNAGLVNIFGDVEPDKINEEKKYLWGKNYITNSELKYEYFLNGIHSSYPDFIMKDSYNRMHLFEVKSVNISSSMPGGFDSTEYRIKVEELKKCYKQVSKLTGYIFYLPVLKDETWYITQLINGEENNLTKQQFIEFVKSEG